jgi:hypothetical protein
VTAATHSDAAVLANFDGDAEKTCPQYAFSDHLLSLNLFDNQGKRQSTRSVQKEFRTIAQQVVGNPSGDGGFPARVTYPSQCKEYCLKSVGQGKFEVCSSIDRALSWLVERHGPVASIAARDLLFVAMVHRGDDGGGVAEAKDLVFFMLVAASARWGHHDPWQSLVLLKMVTDDQPAVLGGD